MPRLTRNLLLTLLLALTTTGLAQTSQQVEITFILPAILHLESNLHNPEYTILPDGSHQVQGTIIYNLETSLNTLKDWQLTMTANNKTHTITGKRGLHKNIDHGDYSHLNLLPGDQLQLTLSPKK